MPDNPCLTCGACCAASRVSFYWSEADPAFSGSVPPELTEKLTPQLVCMQGTNLKSPRCVALLGEVGGAISCSIYNLRPSPCREFGVDWEAGQVIASAGELERCNRARLKWDLPAISAIILSRD
jgi:uncharacterized protein